MTYKLGDKVITKHGNGYIHKIDKTTYSIVLYIIRLTTGKYIGQNIALSEYEISIR